MKSIRVPGIGWLAAAKGHNRSMKRIVPQQGQESVWDYPRPPKLEQSARRIRVFSAGVCLADSTKAYRVLETSHPPSWYIPVADIRSEFLIPGSGHSHCEWKGAASYWTVKVGNQIIENAAWSYPTPKAEFAALQECIAFYPNRCECFVDDEQAQPQAGGFYGGWITSDVAGPFKGMPGSWGW